MNPRSAAAAVFWLALLPSCAVAELGPIVITPTRTEQAQNESSATVYLLTAEDIARSGAATTSELLRAIPGIQIDDLFGNGSQVNVSLRGFSSTANANTLVLVNGRRLNYSDTASPDLHHVLPRDIARIEVLVGSAGSLYGDQAVGGVVNIITQRPQDDYQRLDARVGSYGYAGLDFTASRRLTPDLAYRLSAGAFDTDNYRDNNAERNRNLGGALEYTHADSRYFVELQQIASDLELPGALIESEFEDDPTGINPAFADDFRNEAVSVMRVGYERDLGRHRFGIDATRRKTDADILQSFRDNPSTTAGYDNRETSSLNPKLSGTLDLGIDVPYVIGVDIEQVDYELEIPFVFFGVPGATVSSNRQDSRSLYFQLNPRLSDRTRLGFGMRHAEVENDFVDGNAFPAGASLDDEITVAELGLTHYFDPQTRVSLRIDQNYRFPKVNELALSNPATLLDTQTGTSIELGFDITRGSHRLNASIYRLDLEDEIEFDPSVPPFGENVNLDKTRRDGATLALYSQLGGDFRLTAELGIVDASFESGFFEGNEISGVADRLAGLRGDYRLDDSWSGYLECRYTAPKYAQGDNENQFGKLDSITVYNAGIAYQYRAWAVNFRVNNLSDERYAEFVTNNTGIAAYQPSPGRNYMLAASYRFE